jgi:hypothetical protein
VIPRWMWSLRCLVVRCCVVAGGGLLVSSQWVVRSRRRRRLCFASVIARPRDCVRSKAIPGRPQTRVGGPCFPQQCAKRKPHDSTGKRARSLSPFMTNDDSLCDLRSVTPSTCNRGRYTGLLLSVRRIFDRLWVTFGRNETLKIWRSSANISPQRPHLTLLPRNWG